MARRQKRTVLALVALLVVAAPPFAGGAWAAGTSTTDATNSPDGATNATEASTNETNTGETDDWRQGRASPGRTGVTSDEGALPYPGLGWSVDYVYLQRSGSDDRFTYGGPAAAPTVTNGTVYLPRLTGSYDSGGAFSYNYGHEGTIVARNATTGDVLWTQTGREETDRNGIGRATGPAAVSNGTVYVGTEDDLASRDPSTGEDLLHENGGLFALDAATGDVEWKRNETWSWGPPVAASGSVFAVERAVDTRNYTLHAVDPETGETQWTHENATELAGVAGGTVYVVKEIFREIETDDGVERVLTPDLVALDAETGDVRWRTDLPAVGEQPGPGVWTDERIDVAVTPDAAYVTANPNRVAAYDATDGTQTWSRNLTSDANWSEPQAMYAPAVADDRVFLTSHGSEDEQVSTVHALDAATGEREWRFETSAFLDTGPSVGNRTVYVHGRWGGAELAGDDSGGVAYALNASDGAERWGYGYGTIRDRVPPVVADGMVFFSSRGGAMNDGWLTAVDGTDQPDTAHRVVNDTTERPNESPTVTVETDPADATEEQLLAGTNVTLTTDASDPDGEIASIEWEVTGETRDFTATGESVTVEVSECAPVEVTVTVTDDDGDSVSETVQILEGYAT